MGDLLVCRVCLANNNSKLFSFFNHKLAQAYEMVTGTKVSVDDGLPFYICSYCSALLLKCVSFKEKCCKTESLLKYCLEDQSELSLDYIRSLDREAHDLILPYAVTTTTPVLILEYGRQIKQENDREDYEEIPFTDVPDEVKFEQREEPVTDKPKRRKRKARRTELDILDVKIEDEVQSNQILDQGVDEPLHPDNFGDDAMLTLKDVEIVTLTRRQQFEEIEMRKNSLNYLNSPYKCDMCYKGFMTESKHKIHMERHNPKRGPYECDVCFSRWPEPRTLHAHVTNSHRRKYICKLCDFVSCSSYRTKQHRHMHNGFKFVCKICGASFSKATSHLKHIRLQHPASFRCEICGECFIDESGHRMHKRAHRDREFQCQCSAEFQTMEALKRHLESANDGHCDPDIWPCPRCGCGFPSQETLKEHVKEHLSQYQCDHCERGFASERSLAIHRQRVHLDGKPRPGHGRPPSVVCDICGKSCVTKATLTYHRRIHTGEKPFQCSECPRRFAAPQPLQIHMRTHTGESPYKCNHCPKAFKHKAALNRHDRVHTGAKPYVCAHCGKAFSQSSSMKLHFNTVHLKMPAPYKKKKRPKH